MKRATVNACQVCTGADRGCDRVSPPHSAEVFFPAITTRALAKKKGNAVLRAPYQHKEGFPALATTQISQQHADGANVSILLKFRCD